MASPQSTALQAALQDLASDLGPMQNVRAAVVAFIDGEKAARALLQQQLLDSIASAAEDADIAAIVTTGMNDFNTAMDAEREALATSILVGTPAEEPPPAE